MMTSAEAARIYRSAENYWFRCPLRTNWRTPHFKTFRDRLDDSERMQWKDRFCVRAVTLMKLWQSSRSSYGSERVQGAREQGVSLRRVSLSKDTLTSITKGER